MKHVRNQLFTEINKLCFELDCSYNINCGGCCYVAACLAEQLERVNIPFKIIHYDEWSCHYAIKVSDRYLNRCDYEKREITEVLYENSEWLYDTYYNYDSWNSSYNRKWNLIVSTKIKSLFNKYANSRI